MVLGSFLAEAPTILRSLLGAVEYILTPVAGYVLGAGIQRVWPTSYRTGRWVWLLPTSGFSAILLIGLAKSPLELSELFMPNGGDEGLPLILITYPTLAACLYSLGMIWEHRRSTNPSKTHES